MSKGALLCATLYITAALSSMPALLRRINTTATTFSLSSAMKLLSRASRRKMPFTHFCRLPGCRSSFGPEGSPTALLSPQSPILRATRTPPMPRDTTQLADAPPDLTTPTLAGLAWLLRHKEAWPEGFEWDFDDCFRCGMGLAAQLWDACAFDLTLSLSAGQAVIWDIPYDEANRIFLVGASNSTWITTEMVADRIDAYLARSAP